MSNKNQNGPAMIKKITLIMLSIIFLHMNTYAYTITTINNKTNLGEKCENSITYQDGYFITSDGTKPSTIQLKNCSPTATNTKCRIAYFISGNGTCTFPFNHQKQTLSAVKDNSCDGEVSAYWVRSLSDSYLYKIEYPNNIIDYFDCDNGTHTTRNYLDKECDAGTTFGYYTMTKKRSPSEQPSSINQTVSANEQISYNTYLTSEWYHLYLTPKPIACPKGYYCEAENCFKNKKPCPAGHTTDGTGATKISDCKITTDTEFCDINGCFTLNDL